MIDNKLADSDLILSQEAKRTLIEEIDSFFPLKSQWIGRTTFVFDEFGLAADNFVVFSLEAKNFGRQCFFYDVLLGVELLVFCHESINFLAVED